MHTYIMHVIIDALIFVLYMIHAPVVNITILRYINGNRYAWQYNTMYVIIYIIKLYYHEPSVILSNTFLLLFLMTKITEKLILVSGQSRHLAKAEFHVSPACLRTSKPTVCGVRHLEYNSWCRVQISCSKMYHDTISSVLIYIGYGNIRPALLDLYTPRVKKIGTVTACQLEG